MKFEDLPYGAPPIYGYEAKWIWDTPDRPLEIFECPAARSRGASPARSGRSPWPRTTRSGCRDWCRVDVRCDAAGSPVVVEVNPLPGILPDPRDNSCFPKAARAAGMSYDGLIQTVADIAWRRISGKFLGAPRLRHESRDRLRRRQRASGTPQDVAAVLDNVQDGPGRVLGAPATTTT